MNKLIEEIIKPILEANSNIKKVVGIYGGRFQPFGPHHLKTYKWLKGQVDDAFITTSDLKKPPRHPMNFKEKVRHMTKMGVPPSKIVFEKSPYNALNLAKKYDKDTTAFVYVFGAKDAGRLGGSGKYFQDYKKNKRNLKGFEENGYYLTAPHVSISVGGKEVSGTAMRELLGSDKFDDKERKKLFKDMFGYFNQGVYNMMTNKFKKLFETDDVMIFKPTKIKKIMKPHWNDNKGKELLQDLELDLKIGDIVKMGRFKNKKVTVKSIDWNEKGDLLINGRPALKFRMMDEIIDEFLQHINIKQLIDEASASSGAPADDGPNHGFGNFRTYRKRNAQQAEKLGYYVVDYVLSKDTKLDKTYRVYPEYEGPIDAVSFFPAGDREALTPNNQRDLAGAKAMNAWKKHIKQLATTVGMELINFIDPDDEQVAKKDSTELLKQQKKEKNSLYKESMFSKQWWKKELLNEGGAYGHMAHPFDDKDLTFGDLKKIIELGLGGQLNREDNVTEKLDGQNIMVSWKDGKLIAARNKGHIKNGGKTALDAKGIKLKFAGRGDIANAFNFAMTDLSKAIKSLSEKQRTKIFNNGYNFMNLEVMWPKSANVINYDIAELVFHGALKYDDNAKVIGEVPGSGRILAGMIQQRNQNIQKKYKIGKPVFLDVPKHQDFGKMKGKFLNRLSKLQNEYGLKDNDTLGLYHQKWWESFILKQNKNVLPKVLEGLVRRWAFFEKKYSVAMMKKDIKDEKFLEWVLSYDKNNHAKQVKENMRPFEVLFFEVGAEILKNVKGFIAANPDKAVQGVKKKLDTAIKDVRAGKDLKKLNRLKVQLDRLNAIGGLDSIVPSEGIVFKYKGNTYKFTGAFAPVNQITGLMTF